MLESVEQTPSGSGTALADPLSDGPAERLFRPDGPLAQFPGPALALDRAGLVLAATAAAAPLADAIRAGTSQPLAQAVAAALAGEASRLSALALRSGRGEEARASVHDAMVLPWPEADAVLLLARDVTAERALHQALIESRRRYKDLAEISSDFVWETGPDARFVFVSPAGALGYRPDELVGRAPGEFSFAAEGDDPHHPFNAGEPLQGVETWFRRADGEAACLSVDCRPLIDADGAWRGARGLARDVTTTRALAESLARARHRERLMAYVLRAIRTEAEPAKTLAAAADKAAPALGAAGVRILRRGADGAEAAMGGDAPIGDDALLAAAGADGARTFARAGTEFLAAPARHKGQINGVLAAWRQGGGDGWSEDDRFLAEELGEQLGAVLQQLADREALRALSDSDGLTGLMNRRAFEAALAQRLAAAARAGRAGALLYIDLDNFKAVNDTLGHAAGDAVLRDVATILRRGVRAGDLVARLGGDEFAIWLDDTGTEGAGAKAKELESLAAPLGALSADPARPLGLSIGVTPCEPGRGAAAALMAEADAGMYEAKRARKAATARGASR
jgi:diguanylate cyclase (GGDEF)-like protein/PAS domain S-box-containing protein